MLTFEKILDLDGKIILSFDLEWTKNYRIPNGNKPFCFSFVYFAPPINLANKMEEGIEFGFVSKYIESDDEIPYLIQSADQLLSGFTASRKVTIVGHQLSSDISIILAYPGPTKPTSFFHLREWWKGRHYYISDYQIDVFDTRYDLDRFLKGKSRRLVDVCAECNMEVTQPEIISSMTKMQNDFLLTKDYTIMERLTILNIRHSLSAAILYSLFSPLPRRLQKTINVNRIIYNNIRNHFEYVRGERFRELL